MEWEVCISLLFQAARSSGLAFIQDNLEQFTYCPDGTEAFAFYLLPVIVCKCVVVVQGGGW
jgi:hypothetical protein